MFNLSNVKVLNDLKEDNGIHLDVEIYKPIDTENAEGKFGVFIAHDGSSGSKREYVTTSEEVADCIKDYIENFM